jgi:hypothetical protein
MDWREKARAAGVFFLRNADALFVILVAAGVLILEVTGTPDEELLDSTLLALLGVMALVLLRDRYGRNRVDEIAAFVQDLQSDRPYQVQFEVNKWDIQDAGRAATFTKTQGLVFTRNEVCTLEHWSTGTGHVDSCSGSWRLKRGEPWIGATTIHDFGIHNGRNYIFSLDMERSRGDILQWQIKRSLRERFSEPRESVSLKLQAPTHRPRLVVVWPADREPSQVELQCDDQSRRELKLQRNSDGRLYVDEHLPPGAADTSAKIEWTW